MVNPTRQEARGVHSKLFQTYCGQFYRLDSYPDPDSLLLLDWRYSCFLKNPCFLKFLPRFLYFLLFSPPPPPSKKSCLSISVPQLDIENLNNQRKRRRRREEEDSRVCISPSPLFSFLRSAHLRTCLRLTEEEEGEMMMTTLPLPYFVSRPDGQKYFFFLLSAASKMPSQQDF